MDGATDDETGRRIGMFCVGLALTGFFTFVGGGAFALANENFYADYWQGWAEARDRLAGSLGLAAVVGVSVTFAGLGIWCVGRAVVGSRPRRRT